MILDQRPLTSERSARSNTVLHPYCSLSRQRGGVCRDSADMGKDEQPRGDKETRFAFPCFPIHNHFILSAVLPHQVGRNGKDDLMQNAVDHPTYHVAHKPSLDIKCQLDSYFSVFPAYAYIKAPNPSLPVADHREVRIWITRDLVAWNRCPLGSDPWRQWRERTTTRGSLQSTSNERLSSGEMADNLA